MGVATDAFSHIPTIIKTYKLPDTEDWRFYTSDLFGSIASFLSLTRFTIGDLIYPVHGLFINSLMLLIIILKGGELRKK
jgi:hypothetical protein